MSSVKNILLTGGLGYIGSHAASVLVEAGYEVVILDNLSKSEFYVLKDLEALVGRRLSFLEGDVCDQSLVEDALKSYGIDAVIHFAGLKSVADSIVNPISYFSNNVSGTIALLKAMQRTSVKTLVFSSSATVYGVPQYLPIDEQHPRSAINPYGLSKLMVEQILQAAAQSDPGFGIACMRYFNPVGAHSSGLIGENPNDTPSNLMPFIARVASGNIGELHIFGDDYDTADGSGVRDYIHVMDLVEGHISALEYLSENLGFHAFNLGTGKGYSVFEMISAYESASGKSIPFKVVGRRPGDVPACFADTTKAEQLLSWRSRRKLEDMCNSVVAFQRDLANRK